MAPGLCIGEGDIAMAQATHGSAPDIAGKGIANPFAMVQSARMMIEWLGHNRKIAAAVEAAGLMDAAIVKALANPATRTKDIRGTGNTADMTRGIITAIEGLASRN
jgi:3-isopropylmalate dehydrogenase